MTLPNFVNIYKLYTKVGYKTEKELPKRKCIRLQEYVYNSVGTYFLTICIKDRKNILSTIVGEGSPLPDKSISTKLSPYGKAVDEIINRISQKYPEIIINCYVIIPNHIHLLLSVIDDDGRGNPSPTIISVVGWLKYQATKEINIIRNTPGNRFFNGLFTIT